MIDIQKIYDELQQGDSFKRIGNDKSPISIYCGLREVDMPSIAFMCKNPPILIESTQYLRVSQWEEKDKIYWTSFDLQLANARTIFYALCLDLINAATGAKNENDAMRAVKSRYMVWRKMFRKATTPMSFEAYQGLYGELYFLYFEMTKKYLLEDAIKSWSGASRTAKDFSIDEEWFEVKTITTNATEVKISSLTQLDSDEEGHLVVLRVEKMSEEYNDGHATVNELMSLILKDISDEGLKDNFLEKVAAYGYVTEDELQPYPTFKVHRIDSYRVDEQFPKITSRDVAFDEITKVTYCISTNGTKGFLEVQ